LLSTERRIEAAVNTAKLAAIAIVLSILGAVPAHATTGCIAMGPNYLCADAYPGLTFDQKVNACIAALPATGGTCDGRALPQTDTMSASVTLTAGVTVLLPVGAIYQATAASFFYSDNSRLIGAGRGVTWVNHAGVGSAISQSTSAAVQSPEVRDLSIQGDGTAGAIALNLIQPVNGVFENLSTYNIDVGVILGPNNPAGCACYNDLRDIGAQATSFGIKMLPGSMANRIYGGKAWASSGVGLTVTNSARAEFVDIEGSATASIVFAGNESTVIWPYIEASGPIMLNPGVFGNQLVGAGGWGGVADNSGNDLNDLSNPSHLSHYWADALMGLRIGAAASNDSSNYLLADTGNGSGISLTYGGYQNTQGNNGPAPFHASSFVSSGMDCPLPATVVNGAEFYAPHCDAATNPPGPCTYSGSGSGSFVHGTAGRWMCVP
jgi:uncharacterized membrane protein YjjB (DUF3815 family)